MDTEQQTAALIQKAYEKLKGSVHPAGNAYPDMAGAAELLERALAIDFDEGEVKHALKCVRWWMERIKRLESIADPYEKGAFIFSQLKQYYVFLARIEESFEQCQYAVRRCVFSIALNCFRDLLGEGANQHDPELLLLIGRCYKGSGCYDEALRYLEQAARFRREDGETLAEMADVNALLGEERAAKALFREAFYLDPASIDLYSMESALILRLRDRVAQLGYKDTDLAEWMPVYGCIWKVFSVRRELKQVEIGRLKQSILEMETEFRGGGKDAFLKPRLLNRYFWLLDHYERIQEDSSLSEELLLKIKIIDPEIYERYSGCVRY
jgi:tetratricopeptide (TPR) repeat protein